MGLNSYDIFSFQKNNCIIYQDIDENDDLSNVKLALVDEASLTIKNEITLFDFKKNQIEFKQKKVIAGEIKTFAHYLSENKKMLLVISEPESKKDDEKIIYFTVTDENLKIVTERKIDFKDEEIVINNYLCDDEGNVYIAYSQSEENGKRAKKGELSKYSENVMVISPNVKNTKVLLLNQEGHSLHNIKLQNSIAENKIYVLGAYSVGWNENFAGVFYATIDKTNKTITKVIKSGFPEDIVKSFDKDGFADSRAKKFGLSRYFYSTAKVRGDGSVDYIMQYSRAESPPPGRSGYTSFYAGNILDAHILNDKVIFSRIPIDMMSPGTQYYLAFSHYSNDENLIFLYNDNSNNIKNNTEDKPRNGVVQKSEICATTVSKTGMVTRQFLLNDFAGKNIGDLNKIFPISNNSYVVVVEKLGFGNMGSSKSQLIKVYVK